MGKVAGAHAPAGLPASRAVPYSCHPGLRFRTAGHVPQARVPCVLASKQAALDGAPSLKAACRSKITAAARAALARRPRRWQAQTAWHQRDSRSRRSPPAHQLAVPWARLPAQRGPATASSLKASVGVHRDGRGGSEIRQPWHAASKCPLSCESTAAGPAAAFSALTWQPACRHADPASSLHSTVSKTFPTALFLDPYLPLARQPASLLALVQLS